MRAVITVIGKDRVGIIAGVSALLAEHNVNILDISQTTMRDLFTMILLADLSGLAGDFAALSEKLDGLGADLGLEIQMRHEDIFNSMHRV